MAMFARFRSPDRDQQTDSDRMGAVKAEIVRALASVDREHAGLKRRLDEVSTRVASLLGNEDGIYFEREAEDEKRLCLAESELLNGMRRLRELEKHREMFARLACLLDE